jgi:hypothetical protein
MTDPQLFPEQSSVAEHEKKASNESSLYENISTNVTTVGSRLRILEERYVNLRKKAQMTDNNLLDFEKNMNGEVKLVNQEVLELKKQLSEVLERLGQMASELKNVVRQTDFKTVESYLDMWQPMNFVTRNELKKYLEENKG